MKEIMPALLSCYPFPGGLPLSQCAGDFAFQFTENKGEAKAFPVEPPYLVKAEPKNIRPPLCPMRVSSKRGSRLSVYSHRCKRLQQWSIAGISDDDSLFF
ncbi:MAG TPA: hypothetical protein PKC69_13115 [Chitinophagaceae bacterium]|nr:hypothetical protein [Chitinophagaceae bacterium]